SFTCGVRSDGTVVCWGLNNSGQASPPADTFTALSAGGVHACGVKSDGTVACWGFNGNGQATPAAGPFTALSAGNAHTCGVKTDGTVACWGFNGFGQLGAAPPPASPAPPSPTQMNAAYSHMFTSSAGSPTGSFAVTQGSLPPGLSLSSAGSLTGTPTAAGTFTFNVTISDGLFPDASAAFTLQVLEATADTIPPTTVATATPASNGAGWNNANVTVTLAATDNVGGSGVQSITYVLTGAQTGGGSVAASTTSILITAEGTTAITFHAQDNAGNVEADKTVTIRLDKTAPVIGAVSNVTTEATSAAGAVATFTTATTDNLDPAAVVTASPASGRTFALGVRTAAVQARDADG